MDKIPKSHSETEGKRLTATANRYKPSSLRGQGPHFLYRILHSTLSPSRHNLRLRLGATPPFHNKCSTSSSRLPLGSSTLGTRYKDSLAGSLLSETLAPSPPILFPPSLLLHLSRFWMLLFPLLAFQRRSFRLTPPGVSSPLNVSGVSLHPSPLPSPSPATSLLLSRCRPASSPFFCLFSSSCWQLSPDSSSSSQKS